MIILVVHATGIVSSNLKTIRQFPDTLIAQYPFRLPLSECNR